MPMSARFIEVVRFARLISLGLGLFAVAGCGPPEAGSVKLPESFKRSGPRAYGPAASEGPSPGVGPGQFRPEPPRRAGTTPRGGRPSGSKK
jgi:hypothetical protein